VGVRRIRLVTLTIRGSQPRPGSGFLSERVPEAEINRNGRGEKRESVHGSPAYGNCRNGE
jgi:hypothetical protein